MPPSPRGRPPPAAPGEAAGRSHPQGIVGKPQVALRLPFAFPLVYKGNGLDFSRDLSTIVYARPGGQADLYLLSQTE